MTNSAGNKVMNHFIIVDGDNIFFQSYDSVIVRRTAAGIELDRDKWCCNATTSKYRNLFLNETTTETKRKIKDGTYTLTNLNE